MRKQIYCETGLKTRLETGFINIFTVLERKTELSKKILPAQNLVLVAIFNNIKQRNTALKLKYTAKNHTKTKNSTSKTYILLKNWYKLYYVARENDRSEKST